MTTVEGDVLTAIDEISFLTGAAAGSPVGVVESGRPGGRPPGVGVDIGDPGPGRSGEGMPGAPRSVGVTSPRLLW